MSDNFKSFVETLKAQNTIKVVNSFQAICQYDYTDCTTEQVEQVILSLNPNSPRAIITICYVFSLYAKYLENDKLLDIIQAIDRNALWKKAKPTASKKFISNEDFESTYHDVGIMEETNAFYYQTLFRALYEGIYSDDMSVLKNLRASDINGNVVTLHDDNGNTHDLEISLGLAEDLKELGRMQTWERKNKHRIYEIKVEGLFPDSCFKTEIRKGSSKYSYRFTYYRILRKIAKEYLEYNLLPLQLYTSGIMHRITLKLNEHNIDLEEAFSDQNRDRLIGKIISDELNRCGYVTEVKNFRQMVKGHLEIFRIN